MCPFWASSLQTLGAVISRHPMTWVTLSRYDRCWTADALLGELAIFLQDCPDWGLRPNTEKAGKMGTSDATRSVSSASTHLHHCHISWSQGCEVIQTSGPSTMFSKWMAFCQLGLAPSAVVSTLKSEGQRGDDVLGWKSQRLIEELGPFSEPASWLQAQNANQNNIRPRRTKGESMGVQL
ncbi:uncharacterized protein LOC119480276 isoform X2 [Sebastes umbrosus]|uniref:uncharacterized protein LOC119480276 isoform X2 n=1 Tax=Sebastes umbrosus TaxID=72105 RepID=UPI00189D14D5|nr:uncharacterized protein LOC119480276 isoform X2 [Sebastes umbrosus]